MQAECFFVSDGSRVIIVQADAIAAISISGHGGVSATYDRALRQPRDFSDGYAKIATDGQSHCPELCFYDRPNSVLLLGVVIDCEKVKIAEAENSLPLMHQECRA
ncbi:hypothetical protein [Desulfobulbus elongatus]|uniref:hypothetical protein n=1 Tax=Desulfobulbus elongatus TaxID=53332 RepID=UPI0012FB0306|nr:hypothetical protein [Desulfobulbus elongatus]